METIYLCIVIFLLCLAVFYLFVGVSNDAVNFLQSAVGARVASFRTILIIASVGVMLGAVMSSGMMDVARHGIMMPAHYSFHEVMTIMLAVMVTDIIVLDAFNTLGMPTSTTVSLVFELLGGAVTAFCLPVGTFLITSLVCLAAAKLSPWLGLAVQMFWCGQALAAKGLAQESTNVYHELVRNDLPAARKAVSRIVGRDTQDLTAEGVTKAAVETVAENASDGVIAPLLYMLIGGAPLALTYKAINTMDSMLGYKNEKYLYFGRAAAKLDDVANYIPSRLAALLWVAAAAFTGNDAKGAWRIWRRDRRNHASPNSAQTESACAGALGVQLAGPAYYFGEYYPKPTIGDPLRPIEPEDILRADRMMYAASGLALAFGSAIRGFLG